MTLFFGLIIALSGVLFLGGNLDWWSVDLVSRVFWFWPVILIILGSRMIIKNNVIFTGLVLLIVLAITYLVFADLLTLPWGIKSPNYSDFTCQDVGNKLRHFR